MLINFNYFFDKTPNSSVKIMQTALQKKIRETTTSIFRAISHFFYTASDIFWPKDLRVMPINQPIRVAAQHSNETDSIVPYLFHGTLITSLFLLNAFTAKKIEAYINTAALFLLLPPAQTYFLSLPLICKIDKKTKERFENFKQTKMKTPLVKLLKNQMVSLYGNITGRLLVQLSIIEQKIAETKKSFGVFYDNSGVKWLESAILLKTQNTVTERKNYFVDQASPEIADLLINRTLSILKKSTQFFLLDQTIAYATTIHKTLGAASLIFSGGPNMSLLTLSIKVAGAAFLLSTDSRKVAYAAIFALETFVNSRNNRLRQIGRNDPLLALFFGKNYFPPKRPEIAAPKPVAVIENPKTGLQESMLQILPSHTALHIAVEATTGVAVLSLAVQKILAYRQQVRLKHSLLRTNVVEAKAKYEEARQMVDEFLASKKDDDFDKIYHDLLESQDKMFKEWVNALNYLTLSISENKKSSL